MTPFWFVGGLAAMELTMRILATAMAAELTGRACPVCQMHIGHCSWCLVAR